MEDLLQRMVTEGQRSSAHEVVRHSHEALELLCDKMSLMRSPMNEVRDKCCQAFRSGLSAPDANHKLSQLSIAGLKLMLRQDMYWTVDSDEYEHQLPSQLIDCIRATIGFNSETTQLDLLSILSELSFSTSSLITLDTIEDIIEICCQLKIQSVKHRQAVETTAGQSCHHFFKHCLIEVSGQTDADGEDMTQLVKYIVEQLARSHSDDTIGVLLKCLHYSLLTIPIGSPVIDIVFHDIVWQTMIPTLIKILSPIDISHQKSGHDSSQDFGRGSECVTQMHISDHKTVVFKIAAELLRLLAEISSLRPSIESLFHRLLLCPPVSQRLDAIKWLEEILKNVNLLVGASVEPLDRFGKSSLSKDLDLLHIVMDSLEECSLSNDSQTALQAIASMVTFLRSLQIICGSEILEPTVVHRINSMYPNLADADFEGFEVRQSTRTVVKPEQSSVPQRKVSLTTLKERIVGFNEQQQMNQTAAEEEAEQKAKKKESDRNLRNYKVEAYKSKLKEIMDSRSTDSYNESTDVETHDNVDTSRGHSVTEKRDMDDMDDHWTARESDSSLTEGPAYEDCVEQIADKEEYHSFAEILHNDSEGVHCERNNARRFITSLKAFLPELLSLRTCVEADQAMQTFASNYCTGLLEWQKSNRKPNPDHSQPAVNGGGGHMTIVNADGIYLSTYSTLLLNLKLIQTNFYDNSSSVPMTEREFIEDIQNCGILVYISRYWLAELYQRVLADNLLVNAGYDPSLDANVALVNLLIDLDGLNNCQPGGQQLCDYRRLEKTMTSVSHQSTDEVKAAHKLVRRLITAFWETAIGCLGIAFKADSNTQLIGSAFSSLIGRDGKDNSRREMIILSLEGLQICAKLCIQLGLQSKCDKIFELLSLSVDEADVHMKAEIFGHKNRPIGRSILEVIRSRGTTGLHTSSVMSLQVLLSCSLEVGSHCPVCWRYVFKCCQHIMELEHCYFTSRHASILSSTRTSIVSLMRPSNKHSSDYEEFNTTIDSISMPGINEAQEVDSLSTIDSLISESIDNASDSVLKDKPFERVIGILSHLVDFLFEDAANKLNLRCLQSFVTELCLCSAEQLSLLEKSDTTSYSPKSLLLFRLSDVMLRCAKSGRPLLHFMKCWSIVASHLVEAVSHSDHTVAKKSVSTLHDIINAMLYSHNELPHFHFNEALFKPFECLLLQELCDLDIQELIISSICEFVEGTTEEIRSGWRSLFGALRGIRFTDSATLKQSERSGQLRIILDIFEAFLHTDNLQVFANASVDCLLCLLKLIKSPNNSTDSAEETSELCMISLRYLDQLMSMLRSMYRMPGCPVFSNIRLSNSCVNTKFIDIARLPDSDSVELKSEITLKELDRSVQILQVCFLLVDEFAETLDKCHPKHRNTAVDMLFNWLKSFMESIDPRFGVYCINHILLPSLQRITRQTLDSGSETSLLSTLRHMFGSTADLLVTYFELADKTVDRHLPGLQLMLTQTLLVYIECLNGDYKESIAKLSCACIRHILLSVRTHIDNNLWQTTIQCLSIAHKITLQSLETLVNAFNAKSQQFFDDLDQIQVLSRRDPNEDSEQLCRLAQQIFLLDIQKSQIRVRTSSSEHRYSSSGQYGWTAIAENRSFVFLIKSKDNNYLPVSFRVLIVQLTCHWLLLQTICSLSLCGIDPVMANVKVFMDLSGSDTKPSLLVMDSTQRSNLISLLDSSYRIAMDFDSKPGLKFLIQKISRCEMPSNLYRFSSLVWSVRVVIDVFLISQSEEYVSEAEDDLKHCLTDLTDRYCQLIRTTETTESSIDKISHQSLHFLQASNEELMNIIGRRDLKTGINDRLIGEDSDDDNEDKERDDTSMNGSDDAFEESKDDVKVYNVVTQDRIDSMVSQYKRYKTQHSANPQTTGQRPSTDRPEANSTEAESNQFLLKDSQASKAISSDILKEAIDLSLALADDRFDRLVPVLLPSIQSLVIDCNNKELRTRISKWITRIARNVKN